MPIYDGVVTVAEADIPVIVELDEDVVRLSASGKEIGRWPKSECEIRHLGNATYAIEAEDEILSFVPSQPSLFAAAVNGVPRARHAASPPAESAPPPVSPPEVSEAPPAKATTMGMFYGLCILTAGLAVWSIVSLIF
jgi:hypothetical protein